MNERCDRRGKLLLSREKVDEEMILLGWGTPAGKEEVGRLIIGWGRKEVLFGETYE